MNIYKNSEVSKKFGVSPSTVSLWIQNSLDGKNNLFLVESKANKPKIAKTQGNDDIMMNLKQNGNKYKPLRSSNKLQPKKSFYEVFDKKSIFEIINSMEFSLNVSNFADGLYFIKIFSPENKVFTRKILIQ